MAGAPRIDGPIEMSVDVVVARPKTHYRKSGELALEGTRNPWPVRRPDLDNVLKLVADALNQCCYQDDAQIALASVHRRWAKADEFEHLAIVIKRMPLPLLKAVAA